MYKTGNDPSADLRTLFIVEERFQISGRGLALVPDLRLLDGFQSFEASVRIVCPDGRQFDQRAQFRAQQIRLADGKRLQRLVLLLADAERAHVPVGSEVRCAATTCRRLGMDVG
ncbi:MAG: hypothetical protein AAF170_02455 [Bacteroidota bacterium]